MMYVDIPSSLDGLFHGKSEPKMDENWGNLPSGKRLTMENPFLMSKSTNFLWPFSIAMFDITRG